MRHKWRHTQSLGLNLLNIDLLEVKDDMVMQVGRMCPSSKVVNSPLHDSRS